MYPLVPVLASPMSDGSSADGVTSEPTTLSPSPSPLFPPDNSDDSEDDVGAPKGRLHFFEGVVFPRKAERHVYSPVSSDPSDSDSSERSESRSPSPGPSSSKYVGVQTNGKTNKVKTEPRTEASTSDAATGSKRVEPCSLLSNNIKKVDESQPSCSNNVKMELVSSGPDDEPQPTCSNNVNSSRSYFCTANDPRTEFVSSAEEAKLRPSNDSKMEFVSSAEESQMRPSISAKMEPVSSADEPGSSKEPTPSSSSLSDSDLRASKKSNNYVKTRFDLGTKAHPGGRYIYFEDPPYKMNSQGFDYDDPKSVLNLPTIDRQFKPDDLSVIPQKYRNTRRTFKKFMQGRDVRVKKLAATKLRLKRLEELVPTFAAFLRMLDEELRYFAEKVLHLKIIENLPKEAQHRDKLLKYLTREKYGCTLTRSLERYTAFLKELSEKITAEQSAMILEILVLFRGFAEREFNFIVKHAPEILTEATGKSIQEILSMTVLTGNQLGEALVRWVKQMKEFNEEASNRKTIDDADVGDHVFKLGSRAASLFRAMISDKAEARLGAEEFAAVKASFDELSLPRVPTPPPPPPPEKNSDDESDDDRSNKSGSISPDRESEDLNGDADYHSLERSNKWYQHFKIHRDFEILAPLPEKDPVRKNLVQIKKDGVKAQEVIEDVITELRKRRRVAVRLKRLGSDMKKRRVKKMKAMETMGSDIEEEEEEPEEVIDDRPLTDEEMNQMRREVKRVNEKCDFYKDSITRLKDNMQQLEKEIAQIKAQKPTDPDAVDPNTVPEIVKSKTEVTKLCHDIKIINRESKILDTYASTVRDIKKTLKEHIISEESEILTTLKTFVDNDTSDLEELRRRNEEDTAELATLDPLPDPFHELAATIDDLVNEDDRCLALNDKFDEENDEIDKAINETETALNNITKDFDTHIRIDLNFAPVKNLPIMDTELDDFDVQLLFGAAKYNAMADIDKNADQLTSKEFGELIMKESAKNDAEALEAVRLKQVLLYLYHATPEEKRVLYTQEAERRVRFTRHAHERAKELNSFAQSVFTAHTTGDEKLAELYCSIMEWKSRLNEFTKAQEERNSRFLEFLLRDVTKIKKAREIEAELQMEHDQLVEELKETTKVFNEDPLKSDSKGCPIGGDYFLTVEAELELNGLTNELAELESLTEIEQKRVSEMQEWVDEKSHDFRKTDKKLTRTQGELDEAKKTHRAAKGRSTQETKSDDANKPKSLEEDTLRLQALLRCSNCMQRNKSAVITTCNHLFCAKCIDNLVKARNRKCPKCKLGFGTNDWREVVLLPPAELEKAVRQQKAERDERESS